MKLTLKFTLLLFILLKISSCSNLGLEGFAAYYDDKAGPGGIIAIFQNGETKYTKSFGNANITNSSKFTSETVFPISSMSKHITAACVLKLVEEEKISLDQDILDFFPELSSFAKGITIADLLNHTSGIPSRSSAATMRGQQIYKYEKDPLSWLIDHGKLEMVPGTKYQYGNTSYYLAGEIVRIVSEKSLQEFAQEVFFSKLGMTNTFYRSYPDRLGQDVAMGYAMNNNNEHKKRPSKVQYIGPVGVFTTIDDFKKWDEAFHNKKLLPTGLHELFNSSYELDSGEKINYAYGLRLDDSNGVKKEFHAGQDYDVGYVSYFARYPDYNLTYVIFANSSHFAMKQARDLVEEYISDNQLIPTEKENLASHKLDRIDQWKEAKSKKKIKRPLGDLKKYEGIYRNENLEVNYRLKLNEEDEVIEINVNEIDPLEMLWLEDNKAIASSHYSIKGIWLSSKAPIFNFYEKNDTIDGFHLDGGGTNSINFKKIQ